MTVRTSLNVHGEQRGLKHLNGHVRLQYYFVDDSIIVAYNNSIDVCNIVVAAVEHISSKITTVKLSFTYI